MLWSSPKDLLVPVTRVSLAAICVMFLGAWFLTAFNADDPAVWQRDWHCLWSAGNAFIDGRTDDLYTTVYKPAFEDSVCQNGYFWLYPPYALYPVILIGWLSPFAAYCVILLAIGSCMTGALWMVHRLYPQRDASLITFCLAVLASEPFNGVIVTGQNSAWLLLAITGCLVSLKHNRPWWAALALAVLALKPNWIILAVLWLGLIKQWGVIWRLGLLGALMILCTLPFIDWGLWQEFYLSSKGYGEYALDGYPANLLITTHATLRSVGLHDSWAFYPAWFLLQGAIGWAIWIVWRSDRTVMAKGGMMVLATIACNAYTNFYDGLLLTVPAMVWWFERRRYPLGGSWVIASSITCAWIWLWLRPLLFPETTLSPIGLLLAIWAVAEGWSTLKSPTRPSPGVHPV